MAESKEILIRATTLSVRPLGLFQLKNVKGNWILIHWCKVITIYATDSQLSLKKKCLASSIVGRGLSPCISDFFKNEFRQPFTHMAVKVQQLKMFNCQFEKKKAKSTLPPWEWNGCHRHDVKEIGPPQDPGLRTITEKLRKPWDEHKCTMIQQERGRWGNASKQHLNLGQITDVEMAMAYTKHGPSSSICNL